MESASFSDSSSYSSHFQTFSSSDAGNSFDNARSRKIKLEIRAISQPFPDSETKYFRINPNNHRSVSDKVIQERNRKKLFVLFEWLFVHVPQKYMRNFKHVVRSAMNCSVPNRKSSANRQNNLNISKEVANAAFNDIKQKLLSTEDQKLIKDFGKEHDLKDPNKRLPGCRFDPKIRVPFKRLSHVYKRISPKENHTEGRNRVRLWLVMNPQLAIT